MKRETLKLIIEEIAAMQKGIKAIPHGFAMQVIRGGDEIRDIILGEEFDGQDIMSGCEGCEALILSGDDYVSGDDCDLCAECAKEAEADARVFPQERT